MKKGILTVITALAAFGGSAYANYEVSAFGQPIQQNPVWGYSVTYTMTGEFCVLAWHDTPDAGKPVKTFDINTTVNFIYPGSEGATEVYIYGILEENLPDFNEVRWGSSSYPSKLPWNAKISPDNKRMVLENNLFIADCSYVGINTIFHQYRLSVMKQNPEGVVEFDKQAPGINIEINADNSLQVMSEDSDDPGYVYGMGLYESVVDNGSSDPNASYEQPRFFFKNLKFTPTAFYPEVSLERIPMVFHYSVLDNRDPEKVKHISEKVDVCVDGDTYYVDFGKGTVMRGAISDNHVTVKTNEVVYAYIDPYYEKNFYDYLKIDHTALYAQSVKPEYNEIEKYDNKYYWQYLPQEELVFEYDPETKELKNPSYSLQFNQTGTNDGRFGNTYFTTADKIMVDPRIERDPNGIDNVFGAPDGLMFTNGKAVLSSPGRIDVYSLTGSKVSSGYGTEHDLTGLPCGIYIVRSSGSSIKVTL